VYIESLLEAAVFLIELKGSVLNDLEISNPGSFVSELRVSVGNLD
jgi:hypothetical protein